jgi:hypothetical protein
MNSIDNIKTRGDDLGDPEDEEMTLPCRHLDARDDQHRRPDCESMLCPVNRVVICDGDGIKAQLFSSFQDLLDTALAVFGITGVYMQVAGKHLIIVFLSLWY